jgi:hypothetical protein
VLPKEQSPPYPNASIPFLIVVLFHRPSRTSFHQLSNSTTSNRQFPSIQPKKKWYTTNTSSQVLERTPLHLLQAPRASPPRTTSLAVIYWKPSGILGFNVSLHRGLRVISPPPTGLLRLWLYVWLCRFVLVPRRERMKAIMRRMVCIPETLSTA